MDILEKVITTTEEIGDTKSSQPIYLQSEEQAEPIPSEDARQVLAVNEYGALTESHRMDETQPMRYVGPVMYFSRIKLSELAKINTLQKLADFYSERYSLFQAQLSIAKLYTEKERNLFLVFAGYEFTEESHIKDIPSYIHQLDGLLRTNLRDDSNRNISFRSKYSDAFMEFQIELGFIKAKYYELTETTRGYWKLFRSREA